MWRLILEYISKLLGKPVISIYNGKLEGYVKNVLVDKKLKKLVCLELFDDETQEEKLVEMKNMYSTNNDAIMLKNDEYVLLENTVFHDHINPIGFKVYTINGKYENRVKDLTFDDKLNIKEIYLQNNETLLKENILNLGDNLIIKKDNLKVKLSTFKPRLKISEIEVLEEQKVTALEQENLKPVKTQPNKILTAGYEFLIGRRVGQNIYSDTKQLLVKKNSKINSQVIDIASKNGKLKELTTFSLV